ncbi:MAG TPA: PH domain-containing protein [Xanthomonadaceae bacterium]|nr:PH domain-containing protein [Xanthomonadaceae bacterium]
MAATGMKDNNPGMGELETIGADAGMRRVDSRLRWIWWVQSLVLLLPATLAGMTFLLGSGRVLALQPLALAMLALAALACAALSAGYVQLYWQRYRYAEVADGLLIESGVWWRKRRLVPRSRVQHTDVKHGPLQRHMGLATLVVHTAATRQQAIEIPGLTEAHAETLRDDLLGRGGDDAV